MLWTSFKPERVRPTLNSLRHTTSHNLRENEYRENLNWRIYASAASFLVFLMLLSFTIVGIPSILTALKKKSTCSTIDDEDLYSTPAATMPIPLPPARRQICLTNASWSVVGVTVAGYASGLASSALDGLRSPQDIYVDGDGTLIIADTGNNRIVRWNANSTTGVMIAGTGSYGSSQSLLARPTAIAVRGDQLFVSDLDNYRIQLFPLDTNWSSPDGLTLIGQYGRGSDLNQINGVNSIAAPYSMCNVLYLSDTQNQRILRWTVGTENMQVIAGQTGSVGSDETRLNMPCGITFNERRNTLYIADRLNNRILKCSQLELVPHTETVAVEGQLNSPSGVQVDPFEDYLFIADTNNHRILLWLDGSSQGRTIAGNGLAGNSSWQLNSPVQIGFDTEYNLYVVDSNNHRIQRFVLLSDGC